MTTSTILALFLLGIVFLAILIAIIWGINRSQNERALIQAQELIKTIITKTVINQQVTPSHQAWLTTLTEHGYLDLLYGPGIHIILGTPEMGTNSIFRYVMSKINPSFLQSGSMCVYVNINQTAQASRTIGYVPMDEVYKSIIWSGVQVPFSQLQSRMKKDAFNRTGLGNKLKEMDRILQAGLARLSPITVKQSLFQIWQIMGIKQVVFMVENLTAVDPNSIPALLGYLMRTFGHTPSVSFIISGEQSSLVLNKSTNDGNIGIQLMHDARIDINLPSLLVPQESFDPQATSIRLTYLEKLARYTYTEGNLQNIVSNLFSPPDLWQLVFDICKGNLEEISNSFDVLFSYYKSTNKKITVKTMQNLLSTDSKVSETLLGENPS
jgi:hypothetical protein